MILSFISSYYIKFIYQVLSIAIVSLLTINAIGQPSIELTGHLYDSLAHKSCNSVMIVLLDQDSILSHFTRSQKDGSFLFRNISSGKYLMLIHDPTHEEIYLNLCIQSTKEIDIGTVFLLPKTDVLTAVIVGQKNIMPHMIGDTIEYNVSHLKMNSNASVEDMLKRLPGVQVDADGGVAINGKKIQHLLLDGQDVFGSNPAIVTRNFNADMIAKVQVLDKKSTQSEFTGIDDGQTTKTLNLTLKEEKKNGYFGNIDASGDPQRIYSFKGMLGSLKLKQQFALLSLASNTGDISHNELQSGVSVGNNDALGAIAGLGIPKVLATGLHYASKGNENNVVGNMQYTHLLTSPLSNSQIEQVLNDTIYIQTQESHSTNRQVQGSISADFEFKPDTLSAFRITLWGNNLTGQNQFWAKGSSSFNDTLVNNSVRSIQSSVTSQMLQGHAFWRIASRKQKNRIFSITAGINNQNNYTSGYLYSLNNFFRSTYSMQNIDTTDQKKIINSGEFDVISTIDYTIPLKNNFMIGLGYGLSLNNNRSQQITYNRGDGKYQNHVDSLSYHFENLALNQRFTVNLQKSSSFFNYLIGGDVLHYDYEEKNLENDSILHFRYFNIVPRATFNYNLTPLKGFSFYYLGNTVEPSITQLEPVQNNNDPLHITLGNSLLHPSFSNSFGLGFHNFKVIYMDLGIFFVLNTNAISTKTITDNLGRQVSQAVNVSGTQNGGVSFSVNKMIQPLELTFGFNTGLSLERSYNYIGSKLNRNGSINGTLGFSFSKYKPDAYNFQINSNFSYFYSNSSINTAVITRYWAQGHIVQVELFPFKKWRINTNCNYTWRQKTTLFQDNNSTFLWNAFLGKTVLKDKLDIRWLINNILGQNAGISRSISANQVSQTTTNVIGRYWMISAIYRFKKGS